MIFVLPSLGGSGALRHPLDRDWMGKGAGGLQLPPLPGSVGGRKPHLLGAVHVETLGMALLATGFALGIVLWLYGVYCYVQMVRHRVPGTSPLQVAWPPEHLTTRGREFRRRALRTYAAFGLLALVLLLLTGIFAGR